MEQLHGLLGFDAEAAPELPPVVGEGVADIRPAGSEAALQRRQISPEVEEVLPYGQGGVGDHEEPVGLTGLAGLPGAKHLGESDGRGEIGVDEHPEDYGKSVGVAQSDRSRGSGRLVAFGLVVPFDVGPKITLPGARSGGPVVGDPVRGQEQRGDGVHQRRLA